MTSHHQARDGAPDVSHWAEWSDGELIDQAAGACQSRDLLDNATVREAIALNIIAPLRQALAQARGDKT